MALTILEGSTFCVSDDRGDIAEPVMGLFANGWSPVLRALLLTAVVVPSTVYFIVPKLLLAYGKLSRRHQMR